MPQDGFRPPPSPPPDAGPPLRPSDASLLGQVKHLFEDIIEWLELRFELAKTQIEHRVKSTIDETITKYKLRLKEAMAQQRAQLIKKYKKQIAVGLVLAYVGMLVPVFVLITLGLGLSMWLGDPFWGFLIVTILLLIAAYGIFKYLRILSRDGEAPTLGRIAEEGLLDPVPMPQILPGETDEEETEPKALKAYQDEQDEKEKEQADPETKTDPLEHQDDAEPVDDGDPDAGSPNPRNA